MASNDWGEFDIRTDIPHAGRMYDYMLGGTTNFESDRAASHVAGEDFPGGIEAAKVTIRANRDFLGRAVRYMAEAGVRQFLDLGTGIPADDNVHTVAQQAAPDARIVYVDKAGFVLDHDHRVSDEIRFVQLTPPGSSCSIAIGKGLVDTAPGSAQGLQMVVSDIHAARAELAGRGMDVSDVEVFPWGSFVYFRDPDGNGWAVQQLPESS